MFTKEVLTPQLILNWLARILFFTSLAALLPMSQYIEDIGGNKSQIGIVMSAFAVGVLLFRPLVGKQVDNVGRRLVLLFGALVFIIAPLVYVVVHSVPTLIPVRVFHGLGLAAFGTASITLITDAAPKENRGEVISYTGMVNTIAFAGGPALGFFVLGKWGYTTLFTMTSALALGCFVLSLFIKETRLQKSEEKAINYLQIVKQRRIVVAFVIILIVGLVHGGVMFYIPLFLKNIEINRGLFYTTYGVAAFLIRLLVGPLSDRVGRGPLIVAALLLLTAGVLSLSATAGAAMMLISAALYGLGFGSYQPSLTALVADNTTEETRGKIFSFYYGGFDLGISLAGVLLGAIAEAYGLKVMFLICSGLTTAAVFIFVMTMEKNVIASMRCAFSLGVSGKECYVCNEYMEVAPNRAEAYVEEK